MADIELVIKIPEKVYNALTHIEFDANLVTDEMRKSIANGTPLPKGHGRVGDLDKVADRLEALRDNWNYYGNEYESGIYTGYDYSLDEVMDAPTIIETDNAESEDKE